MSEFNTENNRSMRYFVLLILFFLQLACWLGSTQNIITTIAGTGITTFSGDGGAATSATLYYPTGVGLDSSGIQYYFLTLQIFVTLFFSHIQYRQRVHR